VWIRAATRAALSLAHWLRARSVALPILGAGRGGFSATRAGDIVAEEAGRWRWKLDVIEIVRPPPR